MGENRKKTIYSTISSKPGGMFDLSETNRENNSKILCQKVEKNVFDRDHKGVHSIRP